METTDTIRKAGLKMTPQRRAVYEAMMELRHAPIEAIIAKVQSKDKEMTLSTIYRVLDSFCKAGILSLVCHPETGKCNYDITVHEHHHLFDGEQIMDYDDAELTRLIRQYLESHNIPAADIEKIQVQITLNKSFTNKQ
ncbi:Fur family transcriptional regulator [Alistipes provencensis]|uniref:Fur family transcriptional regulator n=1 Tax=Alistipes provencensis TaxID=1816676 RepID=UPI0007ED2D24|nr:transcriptional repressor [Alistipes provencensis]